MDLQKNCLRIMHALIVIFVELLKYIFFPLAQRNITFRSANHRSEGRENMLDLNSLHLQLQLRWLRDYLPSALFIKGLIYRFSLVGGKMAFGMQ